MGEKITLFASSLQGGGTEKICVTLANGFISRGIDVELLVLNLHEAKYRQGLDNRVKLINLNRTHVRNSFIAVARYILKNKPSKILVFSHQLAVLLVILRRFLFLNITIIARNSNTLSQKFIQAKSFWHKYIVHFLIGFFYRSVDHVIAQSCGMADDLVGYLGLRRTQITIINNPLTFPIEDIGRKTISSGKKEKDNREILYVGRLSYRKANHFLIDAFALCLKHKPNLTLRLVGDGPSEENLRTRVQHLGIADKVIFEGFVNDVASYYLNADVTVLTSLCEGFPNVLVESISLGTPVVSFNCPSGPGEIIIDGLNGYLANYLDADDLAKKIISSLNHKWDREKIKNNATRFDSNFIIDKYLKLIDKTQGRNT